MSTSKESNHEKLKKLSKDDLIWIITRMSSFGQGYFLEEALRSLYLMKSEQKYKKADEIAKESLQYRQEYIDLLAPYDGKPIKDIPYSVVKKASDALQKAQKLDKQWAKLMGL